MKLLKSVFVVMCVLLSYGGATAQEEVMYEYAGTVTDKEGDPVSRASIYTEAAITDDEGKVTIRAKYGRGCIVDTGKEDGYYAFSLGCSPTIRITLGSWGCFTYQPVPRKLDMDYSNPVYIVNGHYEPRFFASHYTDEQIKSVKVAKKLNKSQRAILNAANLTLSHIKLRGVVCVTLNDDVKIVKSGTTSDYTLIVTDDDGQPVKGAVVYLKKTQTDDDGQFGFEDVNGKRAFCYKSKAHNVIRFTLKPSLMLNMRIMAYNQHPTWKYLTRPRFEGGDIDAFRLWCSQNMSRELATKLRNSSEVIFAVAVFYVNRLGVVDYVYIASHNNKQWADHVQSVIYCSPRWQPSTLKNSGKPVSVKYSIPVRIPIFDE